MKNIGYYQSCFVRQLNENNCGLACMAMIFRYTGEFDISLELIKMMDAHQFELSLLDLKKMTETYNHKSKCVRIESESFRSITSPIILHTVNSNGSFHFITLFEAKKINGQYFFIIGDPADDIKIIDERCLLNRCPSRSALYLPDINSGIQKSDFFLWHNVFEWNLIPKVLWLFIPLIHLLSFVMGISLSGLLQQLFTGKPAVTQLVYRIAIIILLAVTVFAKGVLNYTKQQLLIKVNKLINRQLINLATSQFLNQGSNIEALEKRYQKRLISIAKYQLSINGLLSIALSDGLILIILFGCLLYLDLLPALVSLMFAALALFITIKRIPNDMFFAKYLSDLHAYSEQILLEPTGSLETVVHSSNMSFDTVYEKYINEASSNARQLSKTMLNNELLGGLNIIMIITLELFTGNHTTALIVVVSILAFLISLILQRIITSLPVIFDGTQAAHTLQVYI